MEKGEACGILQYFEYKQLQDPSFVYAIQLDQAKLVTNLFWAAAQMIVDYAHFGDMNAAKHLSGVFEKFKSFSQDFRGCVYDYDDVDEFENAWKNMINKYTLQENEWLQRLFLRHFERVVSDRRYEELKAEFAATQSIPFIATNMAILDFASRVYTPPIFSMFQYEVLQQLNYKIEEDCVVFEITTKYTVGLYGVNRRYKVTFDSSNNSVNCSYKNFKFVGFLCKHALKILDYRRVKVLPSCHVLRR
ncbi:PREDICTED: protein FAR1-RELATED SEQUENCE 9-like [Nelumbo nucifera]|uniref:Protein FAR1-RELATED SEQUENCE n=1 Tax=Nelumbo nucifera TaxID=4432 RepID=A0A1U8Q3U3_NELNU|nr:PREDICTED: protein FAR1-RELATED SEQUENCE 9-like [Nelumbo nucifera]